jgi:hypothetical protein
VVTLGVGVLLDVLVGVTVGEGVGELDGVGVFVAEIGGKDPSFMNPINGLKKGAIV